MADHYIALDDGEEGFLSTDFTIGVANTVGVHQFELRVQDGDKLDQERRAQYAQSADPLLRECAARRAAVASRLADERHGHRPRERKRSTRGASAEAAAAALKRDPFSNPRVVLMVQLLLSHWIWLKRATKSCVNYFPSQNRRPIVINFNRPDNPADVPATLEMLQGIVALCTAPNAAERIGQIQAATSDMTKTVKSLRAERASFAIAQAAHQTTLDQQSADATKKIAAERSAFDTECRARAQEIDRRSAELDARAAQLTELEDAAREATATAAQLQEDLQKRLTHIRAAMG